jgi:hypothetical protein
MIEDMTVRGLGARTQHEYVRRVGEFAAFLGRSPDTATADDLRCWQLHQREQGVQPPSFDSSVAARHAELDPVRPPAEIRAARRALVDVADRAPTPWLGPAPGEVPLTTFLEGLRVAWREGEVRPTAQPKPSKPRCRTVPDPLAAVTTELTAWFDEEPGITGAALLERLQQRHAGAYPDHLIRTVQRRVKVWRQERARARVLDPAAATAPTPENLSPATTSATSRASVEPRTGGTTDDATRQRF